MYQRDDRSDYIDRRNDFEHREYSSQGPSGYRTADQFRKPSSYRQGDRSGNYTDFTYNEEPSKRQFDQSRSRYSGESRNYNEDLSVSHHDYRPQDEYYDRSNVSRSQDIGYYGSNNSQRYPDDRRNDNMHSQSSSYDNSNSNRSFDSQQYDNFVPSRDHNQRIRHFEGNEYNRGPDRMMEDSRQQVGHSNDGFGHSNEAYAPYSRTSSSNSRLQTNASTQFAQGGQQMGEYDMKRDRYPNSYRGHDNGENFQQSQNYDDNIDRQCLSHSGSRYHFNSNSENSNSQLSSPAQFAPIPTGQSNSSSQMPQNPPQSTLKLLSSTYKESLAALAPGLSASDLETLKASISKIQSSIQALESSQNQFESIKSYNIPNFKQIIAAELSFMKEYFNYQTAERKVRLIEGDIAETLRIMHELELPAGEWPDPAWVLPPFHPQLQTAHGVVNLGEAEESIP